MTNKSIKEIGQEIQERFSWDKISDNLPMILAAGVGLYILDKSIDISSKVKLLSVGTKTLNKAEFFEIVDTIGDNMQIIDLALKSFGVEIDEVDLKKVADFLQNVGTGGKYIDQLYDLITKKFGGKLGYSGNGKSI